MLDELRASLVPYEITRRSALKSLAVLIGASGMSGAFPEHSHSLQRDSQVNAMTLRKGMVGFQLAHEQFTVPELVQLGVALEQAGFDVLTCSDHLQPWQAHEGHSGLAWLTMAAIGQQTHRIWMGTTVTCPSFRYHPAVVAESFATLSLLYPGRIFLGVGSGEALNEKAATGQWPAWPERSAKLVEATDVIRKLWTGQHVKHAGQHFQVDCKLYDAPKQKPPLLMAGNGPKAMHRCGQYADGLITDPKTWKEHKQEFEAGARAAGKDPSKMPVFVEKFVVVGDRSEAERAAQLWRFLPKAWNPYWNDPDPASIEQRANRDVNIEEVLADCAVGTDPGVHVKALQELFDEGVTEVHIHSGQPDQKRVIEFYGKEVLPRLRKTSKAA
jgi:TAT-translocated FGD2 family F420-dependent dehydrogenase